MQYGSAREGREGWRAIGSGTLFLALLLTLAGQVGLDAGVRRMCLEEIALEADAVFVGKVVDIRTRWGDGYKMIWTDYVFHVEEVLSGRVDRPLHTLSSAGGAMGQRAIHVTHVPSFELGATYLVFSYEPAKFDASPSVGVEQGIFREVTDAASGDSILIDYFGYRMEVLQDGTIIRGRLTERAGDGQLAHVLTDDEFIRQEAARQTEQEHRPMPQPNFEDGYGRPLEGPKVSRESTPEEKARATLATTPRGVAVTRDAMRTFVLGVLKAAGGPGPGLASGPGGGAP